MHSPVRSKKPAFAMASADWSQIPADILFSILKSLPLVDYLRFAAVCSSWRSAAKDRGSVPATQPPWLMLPAEARDTRNRTTRFHSISHRETYTIHLPVDDFHDRFIIGSSRGWLVTICRNYDIDLLNPVTGAQIHLPPFIKIPGGHLIEFFLLFEKIIVVPPPGPTGSSSLAHGFTVVALQRSALAVVRAGDERWTRLETTTDMGFCDVICHHGLVYAVTYDGRVASWDLSRPISIKMLSPSLIRYGACKQLYLVESSGDLLLVSRCLKRAIPTLKVHIFKLDCGRREWVPVESLGDRSLFLGLNESLSLSTLGFPQLKSNCIYFTDNRIEDLIFCPEEYRDMGLYHLEDKSVEPYDFYDKQLTWPTPLWFTPNLMQ